MGENDFKNFIAVTSLFESPFVCMPGRFELYAYIKTNSCISTYCIIAAFVYHSSSLSQYLGPIQLTPSILPSCLKS
uniref:Uncharacterized protein n=1 Tax=Solanum tuberosum TaxID=4113 RepID=M0ZTL1_SOLTU